MVSVLPILFLFLICCCFSLVAGAGYYMWQNSNVSSSNLTSTSELTTPTVTTPLQKVVKSAKASQCQSVNAITKTAVSTCTDGATESGITWEWGSDDVSQACKNATKYYKVTATSSYLPNLVLQQTIDTPYQTTAGIKGMFAPWHQKDVTFTVMPLDKNKKELMLYPVSVPITQATDNQSCKTAGVNATKAVPDWNENKNIIDVGVKSTDGAAGGLAVLDESGSEVFFSGYAGSKIGWDNRMIVPEGFSTQSWCQDTGNISCGRVKGHDWNELKEKQKDGKLNFVGTCWANCPSGGL